MVCEELCRLRSNAKQVADWYCLRFGFKKVAYRGLETGSRDYATHVVQQGDIQFAFTSPLNPVQCDVTSRVARTGDAAKDVAFTVDDARGIWQKAVSRGATSVQDPVELKDDHGVVVRASVATVGSDVRVAHDSC